MRVVRLRLGDEALELTEYLAPRGRPMPVDSRSNDRWFQHVAIIVSDMDRAYARLRAAQRRARVVRARSGCPTGTRTPAASAPSTSRIPTATARDPAVPARQGRRRSGTQPSDRLFLGIDHTAIVVADTDASLRFYRDTLGLHVAGESENYGTEQEHLNNVLRRAAAHHQPARRRRPGIELLEYLAPRDGRPLPADQRANDLAHWQTRLGRRRRRPRGGRSARRPLRIHLSRRRSTLAAAELGFDRGLLVRDPDGHALEVVQP